MSRSCMFKVFLRDVAVGLRVEPTPGEMGVARCRYPLNPYQRRPKLAKEKA